MAGDKIIHHGHAYCPFVAVTSCLTESMDDCGLRFVLAMRQHIHLLSTLPLVNRVPLQRQGLKSYSLVWAFHSEANEVITAHCAMGRNVLLFGGWIQAMVIENNTSGGH